MDCPRRGWGSQIQTNVIHLNNKDKDLPKVHPLNPKHKTRNNFKITNSNIPKLVFQLFYHLILEFISDSDICILNFLKNGGIFYSSPKQFFLVAVTPRYAFLDATLSIVV